MPRASSARPAWLLDYLQIRRGLRRASATHSSVHHRISGPLPGLAAPQQRFHQVYDRAPLRCLLCVHQGGRQRNAATPAVRLRAHGKAA